MVARHRKDTTQWNDCRPSVIFDHFNIGVSLILYFILIYFDIPTQITPGKKGIHNRCVVEIDGIIPELVFHVTSFPNIFTRYNFTRLGHKYVHSVLVVSPIIRRGVCIPT